MYSWLILANITSKEELLLYKKDITKCGENLTPGTTVILFRLYHNIIKLEYLSYNNRKLIGFYNKIDLYKLLYKFKNNISGLVYYGHGYGISLLGNTSVIDFVKNIIKNLRPKLICFDACYMADIISLYEIAPYTRYVLASPSWHPYSSIIRTSHFGKFSRSKDMLKYIETLTDEFERIIIDKKEPLYSCCVSFDLKYLHSCLSKLNSIDFSNQKHLPYDKNRYDLCSVIKDKNIVKQFDKIIIKKPNICSEKISGIAITNPKSYTKKEMKIYKNTEWYKTIAKKIIFKE